MSRKWERMVERNRTSVDKARKKQGVASVTAASREQVDVIKGRGWLFPLFLVAFSLFYFISFYNTYPHDTVFWLTGFSYMILGVLMYFVRRPVIRIGRHSIRVRRFNGDRSVDAHEIKELVISPSFVTIDMNIKRWKWTYSRFQHRFPMDELNGKLREFAQRNKVMLREESK